MNKSPFFKGFWNQEMVFLVSKQILSFKMSPCDKGKLLMQEYPVTILWKASIHQLN